MKILQLNAWGGKLGSQIIALLQREQADVVCFQEALRFPGGRSFLFDDIDSIARKAGYAHISFSPHVGYPLMKRTAQMGLAILSKHPLVEVNIIPLRLSYNDDFDLVDSDYNIQSLQHVCVEQGKILFHILNYHGYHIHEHKDGSPETLRQCKLIQDYVRTLSGPVVLCGDFNLAPQSASIALIEEKMVNLVTESHTISTRTELTAKQEVCDYIFTSSDLSVKHFVVLDDVVSDHRALVLEI